MAYILLSGLLLFLSAFGVHATLWRVCAPKAQITALLLVFFALPLLFLLINPFRPVEALAVYLLCYSLSSAYVLSYPAIEAASPTIILVSRLASSGAKGLTLKEIEEMFDDDGLLSPRIDDLKGSGWVTGSDGYLKTTPKGEAVVKAFIVFRKALGLKEGRG